MTAQKEENPHEEPEKIRPVVKTLIAWKSAGRPFRKRSKQYFLNSILIVFLVEIILFLFSQYLLMAVILALLFLAYSLATVPPQNFSYRISTEGITIENRFFLWQELYDFYFKKRQGEEVLHVRTHAFIPGELTLTLGDVTKEHIKEILLPFLPYREVIRKSFMDKAEDWLTKNFPLENSKYQIKE